MSDEKALLAEIWEHPHDDTVRLAYSDWLQENGQPDRAEFIRVQCELARLSYWDESPQRLALVSREERLKQQFGSIWRAEVPGSTQKVTFSRGFVFPIQQYSTKALRELHDRAFDDAPLRKITLPDVSRSSKSAFASPLFGRLAEFDLRVGEAPPEELFEWLANAPHLRHLRWLGVGALPIAASILRPFLHSAVMSAVSELWLNYFHDGAHRLDGAVLREIAGSPIAGGLYTLGLSLAPGHAFPDGEFPWGQFPRLRWLALDQSEIGDDGLRSLLSPRGGVPTTLSRLDLQYNQLTDESARLLADWPGGVGLRHLVVVSNGITDRGHQFLQNSPYLKNLKHLTWRW